MSDDDLYCSAPFRYIQYTPQGIMPCSMWQHEPHEYEISMDHPDPFNHRMMEDFRNDMLANKGHPNCKVCYHVESQGLPSMRHRYNKIYGKPTDVKLTYLEFNLGNLCNLKCRMCGSWSSSKWISDEIELGSKPSPVVRRTIADIRADLSHIEHIRLLGGEPLLEQDMIRELLYKVSGLRGGLGKVSLSFTTNGTQKIDDSLMALLSMCEQVDMFVSVDGIGEINDYQRTGSKWEEVSENLHWYSQHAPANFKLHLQPLWTLLNVGNAVDLLGWVSSNLPRFSPTSAMLYRPAYLSVRNVPDALKKRYTERLIEFMSGTNDVNFIQSCKRLLAEMSLDSIVSIPEIRFRITRLDTIRGESFESVNPEMYMHIFNEGDMV